MTSKARELAKIADEDGDVTVTRNLDASSGTIKLDGNYPVGTYNVALGDGALGNASLSGNFNTAIGQAALTANNSGYYSTALGAYALTSNTYANSNTAVGYGAGYSNTTGTSITVVGEQAGYSNTTGTITAIGADSLLYNTTGSYNTAIGRSALESNTTASNNTAVGYQALYSQSGSSPNDNVALGYQAGYANTTGVNNTFIGRTAGSAVTTGSQNVFLGLNAGSSATTGDSNTFIGRGAGGAITTGSKNTILGRFDGNQGGLDIRTSSNNIVLSDGDGNPRVVVGSNGTLHASATASLITPTATYHEFCIDVGSQNVCQFNNYHASAPYGNEIQFLNASPDDNTRYFLQCSDSVTARFKIFSDGDVVNHDNSYGAISDSKLKEQITDASSQWDDIKSLNIRKYKMKSDVAEKGDSDEHWRLGVVAQEVEAAGMSGLVKTSPDMIENEDGELVESGEYTKQVKYSILYMKAVKALQEAMARIEQLEADVATLKGA